MRSNVSDYNDLFFKYKDAVASISDQEAKYYYINGLSSEIQMHVRSRAPASLKEAVSQALALDTRKFGNSMSVNYVKQVNRPKYNGQSNGNASGKTCYNCGKFGHLAKD